MAPRILRALCAVATLALAACGGGSSDPSTGRSKAVLTLGCVPVEQVKIQLFGDSTMVGAGASTNSAGDMPGAPAPAIQAAMDARFGKGAVLVLGNAVSGTTSQQLIAGTDGVNAPWPQSIAERLKPQ